MFTSVRRLVLQRGDAAENVCLPLFCRLNLHPCIRYFPKASALTEVVIAAAIEVRRDKGPGLIESIYEWCLLKELGLRGLGVLLRNRL